jgi:hypothetical protein
LNEGPDFPHNLFEPGLHFDESRRERQQALVGRLFTLQQKGRKSLGPE